MPPGGARISVLAVFAVLAAIAAVLALSARSAKVQNVAQLYPSCVVSPANTASDCYIRSHVGCGGSCIVNPWYIARQQGLSYLQGR